MKLELRQDGDQYIILFEKVDVVYKCLTTIGSMGWYRTNFRDDVPGRKVNVNKLSDRFRQNLVSNIFDLKKAWFYEQERT
jgi:hypothetical protein